MSDEAKTDEKAEAVPPRPGCCKFGCGQPLGMAHGENCRVKVGSKVVMDDVVQLGGLAPLRIVGGDIKDAQLALFLYTLLRDTSASSGAIERAAVQSEAILGLSGKEVLEISNPFLFQYAQNLARRLTGGLAEEGKSE